MTSPMAFCEYFLFLSSSLLSFFLFFIIAENRRLELLYNANARGSLRKFESALLTNGRFASLYLYLRIAGVTLEQIEASYSAVMLTCFNSPTSGD